MSWFFQNCISFFSARLRQSTVGTGVPNEDSDDDDGDGDVKELDEVVVVVVRVHRSESRFGGKEEEKLGEDNDDVERNADDVHIDDAEV